MIFIQLLVFPPPLDEGADDLVPASYVARRFGCSLSSVYEGRCGTGGIVPVSRDPWRALRAQVEEEHRKLIERVMPKKAEPEPRKKRVGLIRRGAQK